MKKTIAMLLCVLLVLSLVSCGAREVNENPSGAESTNEPSGTNAADGGRDDFEFSLVWGTYGESSYDSTSKTLVKTSVATDPQQYTTTLELDAEQLAAVKSAITELGIEDYPTEYSSDFGTSEPWRTLILRAVLDGEEYSVAAREISFSSDAGVNGKARAFIDCCDTIRDIIISTDEYKSLPEFEFLYD